MADKDRDRTGRTSGQGQQQGTGHQAGTSRGSQGKGQGTPGSGQQKQYHCERCQTTFNSREELDRHEQRTHQGEMQPGRR